MQETTFEKYNKLACDCLIQHGIKDAWINENMSKKLVDWFECAFPEKISDTRIDVLYFIENVERYITGRWMFRWDAQRVKAGYACGLLAFRDVRDYAKHNGYKNDFLADTFMLNGFEGL